ncbi:MAG: hypothetical protein KIS63_02160 [Caldilineales bacterium]|nr:hypothetical protein [Caldilineales bacterium]
MLSPLNRPQGISLARQRQACAILLLCAGCRYAFVQTSEAPRALADPNRLIIKNADFDIVVADATVALDRLAALAAGSGGYLISNQVREDGGYKVATVQFAVPADRPSAPCNRCASVYPCE